MTSPVAPPDVSATVVAIGDVHGCATRLMLALLPHFHSGAELMFLGDLFDRSPEPEGDARVIELVQSLQADPVSYGLSAVTVLRGNHEQMLLDAIDEQMPGDAIKLWMRNGGNHDFLATAREHRDWLAALPLTAIRGSYLFVHAGVRPGVPLDQQLASDLLWIRSPFLECEHGLPYTVVHGHTFCRDFAVTRLPHRIGIDTGAYLSGRLTALPLTV